LSEFGDRLYTGEATIRLSRQGRARVRDLLDAPVAGAVEMQSSTADADGWVTAVVPIESVNHAYAEFMKFGAQLEVVQPQELRSRFVTDTRALTRLYGT
jgi:predicted DNA-binding transcriptional regulator YafY